MDKRQESIISLQLEGYDEPLEISVSRSMSASELDALISEVTENYILELKEKKLLNAEKKQLLLIDKVCAVKEVPLGCLAGNLRKEFRRIHQNYHRIQTYRANCCRFSEIPCHELRLSNRTG
jgi:hypothetical protein